MTNDIVGSSDGPGGNDARRIRCFSDWNGRYTSESKSLAERAKNAIATGGKGEFALDLRPTIDRQNRSGDHVAFLEQGYPAIRFTEPFEDLNHQHQNVGYRNGVRVGDLPEFLEYDYMARVVFANILTVLSF